MSLRNESGNKKTEDIRPQPRAGSSVRMIKEQGQSIQNVSERMSIGQTAIRRWLTQYGAEQSGQPGIGKPLTAGQQRG
jgi:transposase-like protein